jgi:ABC-type uncharacterized transport system substrate-binding protein
MTGPKRKKSEQPQMGSCQGLREAGYVEGQNLAIEYRSADGQPDRLAAAARELAAMPVDVIAVSGTAATRHARGAAGDRDNTHRHDRDR